MQMKNTIIIALALTSTFASAAPAVKSWTNPECATGPCEVKGMKIFLEKTNAGRLAGTTMVGEIETVNKADLKKYALVQYIEGCVYETRRDGFLRMGTREYWGKKSAPFKHVGMNLDSASDRDPIYWSNHLAGWDDIRGFEISRNSMYSYANPLLTESWGAWAGKVTNLKENKIFVQDAPTMSGWDLDEETMKVTARNSSLKFKICLHKISDIPAEVELPNTEIENPIVCMNWDSNFLYNFATRKFVDNKEAIDPICK